MTDDSENKFSLDHAVDELNSHVRSMVAWHFSPDTGTPYWIDWAEENDFDPTTIGSFDDIITQFPHFSDDCLRDLPHRKWIPKAYKDQPFKVFETGGTTGMPKQRLCWNDHIDDYTEFSKTLDDVYFPLNANWLMLGPTGPRRLRLSIEHLANIRGGSCYFVDLDPRWVKKIISHGDTQHVRAYKEHVIDQAVTIIRNRKIECLFTTPLLLEALGERISIPDRGIKGVFCGGTTMTPQSVRFIIEEVLENRTQFVPTYGNTLMGLACSLPEGIKHNQHSVTYWAPQPRAVLRVVNPDNTNDAVEYGQWGRVELTTLTREFFMPRFLERDEAIRRRPCPQYPWDGVGDIRPFRSSESVVVEGVY